MADLLRFYAEARSEISVVERVKEAAYAIETQFEDFERRERITDDEALDLAEAANTATDDGFDWEVIDRTRKPLSRVICRTNRADAMMIVETLNASEDVRIAIDRVAKYRRTISYDEWRAGISEGVPGEFS